MSDINSLSGRSKIILPRKEFNVRMTASQVTIELFRAISDPNHQEHGDKYWNLMMEKILPMGVEVLQSALPLESTDPVTMVNIQAMELLKAGLMQMCVDLVEGSSVKEAAEGLGFDQFHNDGTPVTEEWTKETLIPEIFESYQTFLFGDLTF